jgi:hypothetical protein
MNSRRRAHPRPTRRQKFAIDEIEMVLIFDRYPLSRSRFIFCDVSISLALPAPSARWRRQPMAIL